MLNISLKLLSNPKIVEIAKARLAQPEDVLQSIGEKAKNYVMENFRTQGANLGKPWQPLSRRYGRRKAKKYGDKKPMLELTGRLKNSIKSITPVVNGNTVTIGTNVPYAAIHHYGGTIMQGARSETFGRLRVSSGKNKGRFKKGKATQSTGKGSYTYISAQKRIKKNIKAFVFKSRTITIPPRPFMEISENDANKLNRQLLAWLVRKA
jgi:phage gpG-like protein